MPDYPYFQVQTEAVVVHGGTQVLALDSETVLGAVSNVDTLMDIIVTDRTDGYEYTVFNDDIALIQSIDIKTWKG